MTMDKFFYGVFVKPVIIATTILLVMTLSMTDALAQTVAEPDFTVSWTAPTHSVDNIPLTDIDIEYTIYAGRPGGFIGVYDSGLTETHYSFISPGHCFDVYVTATRMDAGAESDPSDTVQWCPGDEPEVIIGSPEAPTGLNIFKIDTD